MDLKIGPYTILQRTEYSKIQVFDASGKDITTDPTYFLDIEKIMEDYKTCEDDSMFDIKKGMLSTMDIKYLFIQDNVRVIREHAITDAGILYVRLPENLVRIDNWAFSWCLNLKEVEIPASFLGELGYGVFSGCKSLKKVVLPESLKEIPQLTFADCTSLEKIKLPSTITTIGEYSFKDCENLTEIVIPDSVRKIGADSFYGCKNLRKINIPRAFTMMGVSAFGKSGLKEIVFNHNLKTRDPVKYGLPFLDCDIEKITIDKNVKFLDPEILVYLKDQIKDIDYNGTKEEFETFSKKNEELLKLLKSAKVNICGTKLDDIIKNEKTDKIEEYKELPIEK